MLETCDRIKEYKKTSWIFYVKLDIFNTCRILIIVYLHLIRFLVSSLYFALGGLWNAPTPKSTLWYFRSIDFSKSRIPDARDHANCRMNCHELAILVAVAARLNGIHTFIPLDPSIIYHSGARVAFLWLLEKMTQLDRTNFQIRIRNRRPLPTSGSNNFRSGSQTLLSAIKILSNSYGFWNSKGIGIT